VANVLRAEARKLGGNFLHPGLKPWVSFFWLETDWISEVANVLRAEARKLGGVSDTQG
jgi:hypothetical protein